MVQDLSQFITADNEFYALLQVPTRDGGATIKPNQAAKESEIFGPPHHSVALFDTVFKAYVTRMGIYEDYIEVGVTSGSILEFRLAARQGMEPHRSFTLPMKDITEIFRETLGASPGFTIKTHDDDFIFGVGTTAGGLLSSSSNFDTDVLDRIVKTIEDRSIASEEDPTPGTVDELERLHELHSQGALTDKEFQKAKDDLLD